MSVCISSSFFCASLYKISPLPPAHFFSSLLCSPLLLKRKNRSNKSVQKQMKNKREQVLYPGCGDPLRKKTTTLFTKKSLYSCKKKSSVIEWTTETVRQKEKPLFKWRIISLFLLGWRRISSSSWSHVIFLLCGISFLGLYKDTQESRAHNLKEDHHIYCILETVANSQIHWKVKRVHHFIYVEARRVL